METQLGGMAIRILLLTQWFDPEPTFKGLAFARELVRRGFDVEVVTGFPNYPGGKLYSGYRIRLLTREQIDGVHVTRVPLYPSHSQSAPGRVVNYLSFFLSSLVYCLLGAKRPDVIYAYHPPLTVGIAAALVRGIRRVPVVYDIQDMWPDTLRATGMLSNERVLDWVSRLCKWVYRRVDRIVVLSPGFKKLLVDRGVPEKKMELIYNWCNEELLNQSACKGSEKLPAEGKFRIVFAGNMGKAQALYSVLDAASILQKNGDQAVAFVFVGGGVEAERLEKYSRELQLRNVHFLPRVPMSRIGSILKEADALLVHLKNDPLFRVTIPSKVQAYMAIGKPILVAVEGDAADLVQECGCGETAVPENPDSIAAAALSLQRRSVADLDDMETGSRKYYREKLSVSAGVEKFSAVFTVLAKAGVTDA